MINLYNAQIESLSLHKVGNKSRKEPIFISELPYRVSDEMLPLLKEFFLKPFREKEEVYFQFAHEVDLEYNTMYNFCRQIFEQPEQAHRVSKGITQHLFDQSNHPHIKNGEVYVAYLKNITIDNNVVDAVGVFKSEIQHDYIEMHEEQNILDMELKQGIALDKLDKGCIIFNINKDEGYKILSIDSNRYDSRYWLEHFLAIDECQDENFLTRKYLKFCQNFAKDVVLPAEDKKEEVMFLNRSVNFFAKNDQFEETNFLNEVLDNPDLVSEFNIYKIDKGQKYSIEDVTTFDISNSAVSDVRKGFKNLIKLDTHMEIKLNFINPESADKFLEKGWDEEKQMYYYLVYFNKETK